MPTTTVPPSWQTDLNVRATLQVQEYASIADRIASDAPALLFDWGCGYGQMSDLLRQRGVATTAYDYNGHLADGELHPLEKYPHIEARYGDDGVRLPYADESFDAALSCGVLEHVENPGGSLDELRRVLKAGGTLYVYKLPNRASWTEWVARRCGGRLFYHGMAPHDHLYHLGEARELLERHGFHVSEASYANVLPLMLPFSISAGATVRLWALNQRLSRVPGLRRIANNVELVASTTG
jgi:SAM-dependent methyltransferase